MLLDIDMSGVPRIDPCGTYLPSNLSGIGGCGGAIGAVGAGSVVGAGAGALYVALAGLLAFHASRSVAYCFFCS